MTKISKHSLVYWVVIIVVVIYYIKEIIEDWQFWPVFLAIIIGCFVWQYFEDKGKRNQVEKSDVNKPKRNTDIAKKSPQIHKNTTNTKPTAATKEIHKPSTKWELNPWITNYLDKDPVIFSKNGKRVNKRTGYVLASELSIETSKNDLFNAISKYKTGVSFKVKDNVFQELVSSVYFRAGVLAYKRGDWDLAERAWLTIISLEPEKVSKRLSIMFRKQERYRDISDMYAKAINACDGSLVSISDDSYQNMVSAFIKASEQAVKKKESDRSRGVQEHPIPADTKPAVSLAK